MSRAISRLALLGASVLIAANLLSLAARHAWFAELMTHFRLHYAIGGLLLGAWLLIARRRIAAAACLAVVLINGAALLPYVSAPLAQAAGSGFTLVHLNVQGSNRDTGRVLDFLRSADADIVVVQEVDEFWAEALAALTGEYPIGEIVARYDNFGLALFSRIDGTAIQRAQPGGSGPPALIATVDLAGQNLSVLAMHPFPPISPSAAAMRDLQLAAAGSVLEDAGGLGIVIGDLNITPWSPPFRDLLASANLDDARTGGQLAATWPARLGRFGIPIDHCLIDRRIPAATISAGPYVGSDHRGIVCRLTLPDRGNSAQVSLKK